MSIILITIHSLSVGGAQRAAANLANYWSSHGHEIHVATWTASSPDDYPLNDSVTRHAMENAANAPSRIGSLTNNLSRGRQLRRLLKKLQPSVVVSLMTSMNVTVSIASLGLSCKTILCEHTYPPLTTSSSMWKRARAHTYGWADQVVALTNDGANWLENHTNAKEVAVIPNALVWPVPDMQPSITVSTTVGDHPFILNAGRFSKEKGQSRLLRAFARVSSNYPDWRLVLAGSGGLEHDLKALAVELDVSDTVIFPGRVGNIHDWYVAAEIYVLSSDFEGFPISLIEAMAGSCAVVSVDCKTGPADILTDQENGLLVDISEAGLASAIGRLVSDGPLRQKLAVNAASVVKRYDEHRVMAQWETLIDSIR